MKQFLFAAPFFVVLSGFNAAFAQPRCHFLEMEAAKDFLQKYRANTALPQPEDLWDRIHCVTAPNYYITVQASIPYFDGIDVPRSVHNALGVYSWDAAGARWVAKSELHISSLIYTCNGNGFVPKAASVPVSFGNFAGVQGKTRSCAADIPRAENIFQKGCLTKPVLQFFKGAGNEEELVMFCLHNLEKQNGRAVLIGETWVNSCDTQTGRFKTQDVAKNQVKEICDR